MNKQPIKITVFSDLLCIWAYVGQVRIDEVHEQFGERVAWQLRLAFFRDARDITRLDVQLDVDAIRSHLDDGSALAALADDHDHAARNAITGSPTLLFNEGRQKLYGNVGYRIIEANLEEVLRDNSDKASWC